MTSPALSTAAAIEGDTLVFTCTGSAESDAYDALNSALQAAHTDAISRSLHTVVADLRGLSFASSSCLKAFVTWLHQVGELDNAERYAITIRSNPRHAWQRRSLKAIAAFAKFVVIESEPETT